MTGLLLVHSPLIGPYSWMLVSEELRAWGADSVVPSFLDMLDQQANFARTIAHLSSQTILETSVSDPVYLVFHSAAGAFAPSIREALHRPISGTIFVDARLPKHGATLSDEDAPGEIQKRMDLARDGWLPPWSKWFPDSALEAVLPDPEIRRRFVDELKPVPSALFEEVLEVPPGWPDVPCGYIRLSRHYRSQAREAGRLGWAVSEVNAHHLHMLVDPPAVAGLILDIVHRLERLESAG